MTGAILITKIIKQRVLKGSVVCLAFSPSKQSGRETTKRHEPPFHAPCGEAGVDQHLSVAVWHSELLYPSYRLAFQHLMWCRSLSL